MPIEPADATKFVVGPPTVNVTVLGVVHVPLPVTTTVCSPAAKPETLKAFEPFNVPAVEVPPSTVYVIALLVGAGDIVIVAEPVV